MPDHRRVHRFRDHPIAGVNWRPTRFVDELPSSRVCGLCRMIPTRTVQLPCSHILCESCHAASPEGGSRRCPLDQEPFEEAESASYDLPVSTANALKVCCWNEAHGCEYEGAIEDMLQHYEKECPFHAVECLRCGEAVLHRDLATHYVAGCSVGVSSARTETTSSESRALTLQNVKNALEEVKTLLTNHNHDQVLPAIQSQVNELTEQVRNQECRLAEGTGEVRSSLNAANAQHAATASSIVLQESTSRQNPADEASTSTSSQSCSQEMLMNEEPEIFSKISRHLLQWMQKTSTQDFPQHLIEYFGLPNGACHLTLTRPLSTTRTWKVPGKAAYAVTLENCTFLFAERDELLCRITVLHTRDSRFTVAVHATFDPVSRHGLHVQIDCVGASFGSRGLVPSFEVTAHNGEREEAFRRLRAWPPYIYDEAGASWLHFLSRFEITPRAFQLQYAGYLRNRKVVLKIMLSQENMQDGHPNC